MMAYKELLTVLCKPHGIEREVAVKNEALRVKLGEVYVKLLSKSKTRVKLPYDDARKTSVYFRKNEKTNKN